MTQWRRRAMLGIFASSFIAAGCLSPANSPSGGGATPVWVNALILKFQIEPVGNPPQSIYRYTYNDQTVYYSPAQCCDQFSTLYDAAGTVICRPDGGITGQGDGQCPDFIAQRRDEFLIWQDPR